MSLYPSLSEQTVEDVCIPNLTGITVAQNVTSKTFARWMKDFGSRAEFEKRTQQIPNINLLGTTESNVTRSLDNPSETGGFRIDDRCTWYDGSKPQPGTIRWIGYLKGHTNVYAGFEFDESVGRGTGNFQGKQIFQTAKEKAGFVALSCLRLSTTEKSSLEVEKIIESHSCKSEELSVKLMMKHGSDLNKTTMRSTSKTDQLSGIQENEKENTSDANESYVTVLEKQLIFELDDKDKLVGELRWRLAELENRNIELTSILEAMQTDIVKAVLPSTTSTMMQTDSLSHIQWFEEIQCQICNLNLVFDDGGYCCLEKNCHQPICASCFTRYNAREQQSVEPKCPFCRCNFDYLQIAIPRFDNV